MSINDKLAREIVAAHAEALCHGYDVTDVLAGRYPDVAPLLRVAQRVNRSLVLLPVSAVFRAALHEELLATRPAPAAAGGQANPTNWVLGGVALGSAVTGLTLLLLRRFNTPGRPATA